MIPLILADRFALRSAREISDSALKRLYIPQESYLLATELRGDIIVPVHGALLERGYRFKEFSVVKATPDMRSIFSTAQDVNPMDAPNLGEFDSAMIMRNAPIDAQGNGFYFGAGPHEEGYELIERFFDALNIVAPLSAWYIQLAVKPRGWIGYYERPHGGISSFVFRNHLPRIVNRRNSSGSPAVPVIIAFCYRPGRSGHRPPQVSSAMAMNASALWKPLARAVSAASWVLIASARPLLTA